jgi:hypothetical protein
VQIIRGPLGAGKTIATAFKVFKYICEQKPNRAGVRKSRWAIIRNTYPDLTSTTIRDWRTVVPQGSGPFTMGHPPEHKLDFDLPDGTRVEAEVLFIALDKPDDVKKLRGMQLTGVWINEMKEVPKAIFDMATGRVDRYPAPGTSNWVGIVGDTNSWDSDHWLETLAEEQRNGLLPDYEFFVQPGGVIRSGEDWIVNPGAENLAVLKPDYYQRILQGKSQDWIKVNLANEIGLSFDGKAVHPDYSDTMHTAREVLLPVLNQPNSSGLINVGLDFGLTPAAGFFQRQVNGQWFGLAEVVLLDGDIEEFARELQAKMVYLQSIIGVAGKLNFTFRGDPAGDQRVQTDSNTAFRTLASNGIVALPCSTNDPALRRAALDRPITRLVQGKSGLLLSPVMKYARKGLAGAFCYKRIQVTGDEKFRDVPDKNIWSHIVEACEYALIDAGEHAIVNAVNPNAHANRRAVIPQRNWNPFDA